MTNIRANFLTRSQFWLQIAQRLQRTKKCYIAVAYFSKDGASLLPLRRGDTIVVDMSPETVRQGATDPREIKKLFRKGVIIFTRRSLHSKVFVLDDVVIVGSANVSGNAHDYLDEAAIITGNRNAVTSARNFIQSLCSEPVSERYIDECIRIYKPPRFKSVRRGIRRSPKGTRSRLWFVSGLYEVNSPADRDRLDKLESEAAKDLDDPERHEVTWIRFSRKTRVFSNLQSNNWLIDSMWIGERRREVGPPSRVIWKRTYKSNRGKTKYMLLLETPKNGESISFGKFQRAVRNTLPDLGKPLVRSQPIRDEDQADRLLRLWTSTGQISKRAVHG